jgi:hypothetical protein
MPDVTKRVREGLFAEPATSTPASFREFIEGKLATWRVLAKTLKLPDL